MNLKFEFENIFDAEPEGRGWIFWGGWGGRGSRRPVGVGTGLDNVKGATGSPITSSNSTQVTATHLRVVRDEAG